MWSAHPYEVYKPNAEQKKRQKCVASDKRAEARIFLIKQSA